MSMFIGKYGDGKQVFSIRNTGGTGEDPGAHYNPAWENLFHSDMPHIFVRQRHVVNFSDAGWGYFSGWMSDDLRYLLYSTSRVMIPILVFRDNNDGQEFYKQMVGINKSTTYKWELINGITVYPYFGGSASFDLNLEWGYYTQMENTSIKDCLARAHTTTGYTIKNGNLGDDWSPAEAADFGMGNAPTHTWASPGLPARNESRNYCPRNNPPYGDISTLEQDNLIDPHYMQPMGYRGAPGMNAVYIRAGGSRNANFTSKGWDRNDRNLSVFKMDMAYPNANGFGASNGFCSYFRTSLEQLNDYGYSWSTSEVKFNITPVRMEYLELNVNFDRWAGYSSFEMGVGSNNNEIHISKDTFSIKGWDYRNTDAELLYRTSNWNNPSGPSNLYFQSNIYNDPYVWDNDGGAFRLYGVNTGGWARGFDTISGAESNLGNSGGYAIGTYKFPRWSSIEINSTNNSINMNGQQIWGAASRPLMLFPYMKASNVVVGNNEWLSQVAYGSVVKLWDYSFGEASGPGDVTVLLGMEWCSNSLCDQDGDPNFETIINYFLEYAGSQPEGNFYKGAPSRKYTQLDYSIGDGISHQFITLGWNGSYVPIMNTNVISYNTSQAGVPKNRFQFYLRKNPDNHNIEMWGRSNAVAISNPKGKPGLQDPHVQWPTLRLSVQRVA